MHIVNTVAGRRAQGHHRTTVAEAGQWPHVFVTYDGSGKAAGVQDLRQRRAAADDDVEADALNGHDPKTTVPFKIGQRHDGAALRRRSACRTCGSTAAALSDARGRSSSPRPARFARCWRPDADKRTPEPRSTSCSTGGWHDRRDRYAGAADGNRRSRTGAGDAIKARGTDRPRDAGEDRAEPMAFILYRGEYDKRRDPVKAGTPARRCRRCPQDAAEEPARPRPVAAARPSTR